MLLSWTPSKICVYCLQQENMIANMLSHVRGTNLSLNICLSSLDSSSTSIQKEMDSIRNVKKVSSVTWDINKKKKKMSNLFSGANAENKIK